MAETPEHADLRVRLHWETALDRLELDVILTERFLDGTGRQLQEPWDEPLLQGPVPHELRERAVAIAARQRRVQDRLQERLASVGRQHTVANRVQRATQGTEVPVYLDLHA